MFDSVISPLNRSEQSRFYGYRRVRSLYPDPRVLFGGSTFQRRARVQRKNQKQVKVCYVPQVVVVQL